MIQKKNKSTCASLIVVSLVGIAASGGANAGASALGNPDS